MKLLLVWCNIHLDVWKQFSFSLLTRNSVCRHLLQLRETQIDVNTISLLAKSEFVFSSEAWIFADASSRGHCVDLSKDITQIFRMIDLYRWERELITSSFKPSHALIYLEPFSKPYQIFFLRSFSLTDQTMSSMFSDQLFQPQTLRRARRAQGSLRFYSLNC